MPMGDVAFYLDEMPGETRGIVVRNGDYHTLYIERATDRPEHRLGARLVGRIVRVEPGLGAAFVDLGGGEPFGFMPLGKSLRFSEGQKVTVDVTAEARESKGPALRYVGEGQGEVRIVMPAPSVAERMKLMAGGQEIITGRNAVIASLEAEEEALSTHIVRSDVGLDLSIERTRALIAVDIDYAPLPGRDSRKGREAVNRIGLQEVARQLSLKNWGGIVAIDLAGANFHAETITKAAKQAFADRSEVVFGPISRFGLLQVSVPWTAQPIEERLAHKDTAALDSVRRLHLALLDNRSAPYLELVCDPQMQKMLTPLVAALGPRARLSADAPAGKIFIREG